jgi:chloride channel protein, CIC family
MVRISEVMNTDVQPISAEMTVADLTTRISRGEPGFNLSQGLPIVAKDGRLAGVVTQGDLLRALESDPEGRATVLEAGSDPAIVAFSDELVLDALHRMVRHNIGRLPVVSREDPQRMTGYFDRSNILSAWTRQVEDEGVQEHGWYARWRRTT